MFRTRAYPFRSAPERPRRLRGPCQGPSRRHKLSAHLADTHPPLHVSHRYRIALYPPLPPILRAPTTATALIFFHGYCHGYLRRCLEPYVRIVYICVHTEFRRSHHV